MHHGAKDSWFIKILSSHDIKKYLKFNYLINLFKELHRVLIKHDWNVADATVLLSTQSSLKAMTSENKVRAKAAASLHKHKGEQFVSFS